MQLYWKQNGQSEISYSSFPIGWSCGKVKLRKLIVHLCGWSNLIVFSTKYKLCACKKCFSVLKMSSLKLMILGADITPYYSPLLSRQHWQKQPWWKQRLYIKRSNTSPTSCFFPWQGATGLPGNIGEQGLIGQRVSIPCFSFILNELKWTEFILEKPSMILRSGQVTCYTSVFASCDYCPWHCNMSQYFYDLSNRVRQALMGRLDWVDLMEPRQVWR